MAQGNSLKNSQKNSQQNLLWRFTVPAAFFTFFILNSAPVSFAASPSVDLSELSIEDLLQVQVTSVSKRSEALFTSAAAITVISQEDIRRSGATSVPELFRLVPGMDVGKINTNIWGVASRGFNALFANKLLVLVDGRSVYTPLFSGVFWDELDLMLEDIERIEVIRGPGATLWGSNAVNGVINIITKNAKDTVGNLVSAGGGTEERYFTNVRSGAQISDNVNIRAYAKYANRDNSVDLNREAANDAWESSRTGFRADGTPQDDTHWTLQGDVLYGELGTRVFAPIPTVPFTEVRDQQRYTNGENLLGRVTKSFSPSSELQAQLYYDRAERDDSILKEVRHTMDLDVQHQISPFEDHTLVYGIEYRFYHDDLDGTFSTDFMPDKRDVNLATWFLQDDIAIVPDTFNIILGSKFEYNQFTGIEFQPNVRAVWTPNSDNTVWLALSRAVRTPSRTSNDVDLVLQVIPSEMPALPNSEVTLFGSSDVESENLYATELGYRSHVLETLSLDIATFYNNYSDIESYPQMEPRFEGQPEPHIVVPIVYHNDVRGDSYGGEVSADWKPLSDWRLVLLYSYSNIELHTRPGTQDLLAVKQSGQSPDHQVMLRSLYDISDSLQFDAQWRYVDSLPSFTVSSYTDLDLRLGWRAAQNVDLSLVGQNLLHEEHQEFVSDFVNLEKTSVERGVFAKVTVKF